MHENQDEIKRSTTKSSERPFKSKFNTGHVHGPSLLWNGAQKIVFLPVTKIKTIFR